MGNRKSNHSGQIAGVAGLWLAAAGEGWLLAFGGGYGAQIPSWVVAVPVFVAVAVTGFLWFVSKFAHGGDWVRNAEAARKSESDLTEADEVYEVTGV